MKNKICSKLLFGTLFILSMICLVSCGITNNVNEQTTTTPEGEVPSDIETLETDDMFSNKDLDSSYDESEYTELQPEVEEESTSLEITTAGKYSFSGEYEGTITVNVLDTEKVYLVFENASIISTNFAAIYVLSADKVFINFVGENTIKNTGDFVQIDDNNVDGAIFSKEDITLYGTGSCEISSTAHGIVAKDDFKMTEGTVKINATGHGIDANDSVRITTANLQITSGQDGIHCENTEDTTLGYIYMESGDVSITSAHDGFDSSSIIQIMDGTLNVESGGGSSKTVSSTISAKGIKATSNIIVSGGTIIVSSSDDSIHCNESIAITGGDMTLSSGDDGVHADSKLSITGGKINITKAYEGLEGQNIEISSGNISLVASDDGINAAGGNDSSSVSGRPGQNNFTSSTGSIVISGGELYINSKGDGVDSNGTLSVSGGIVIVEGPTDSGNGPLDYDSTGTITGGIFLAIGSSGMAMNFTSATQGSILYNLSSSQSAKTVIQISDSNSNVLYTYTSTKTFNSVLISLPELTKGSTYTLKVGSTSTNITLSSYIYGSSGSTGGGMAPGRW